MAGGTVPQVYKTTSSCALLLGNQRERCRIQISVAVITYCLVAIVEHDYQLGRTTFNDLRVLTRVLTDKTSIRDLFKGSETIKDRDDKTVQLQFEFKFEILLNTSDII